MWYSAKTPSYFSAQDCVKVSPRFAVVSQITSTNRRKNGKLSAIGYTLQLVKIIWKTAANPGKSFTQFCAEKYEGVFALYRMKSGL